MVINAESQINKDKEIVQYNIKIILNPTISYGSILYLRVAGIKGDYTDNTMSVNNLVLTCLAGKHLPL